MANFCLSGKLGGVGLGNWMGIGWEVDRKWRVGYILFLWQNLEKSDSWAEFDGVFFYCLNSRFCTPLFLLLIKTTEYLPASYHRRFSDRPNLFSYLQVCLYHIGHCSLKFLRFPARLKQILQNL